MTAELTIGELSARSGVAASALRFYEREGLIESPRTDGNQRRYPGVTLRRVALVQAGKAAGIPLERIRAALDTLPAGRSPTKRDWERLSRSWGRRARPAHRDARGDPRAADDLHRVRLPVAEDVRAAQPGRPGRRARAGRAVLPAGARRGRLRSSAMDETWRSELQEFLAIPSVSADPAHREDVKRAGEWVCDFIRRAGGTAELVPHGDKELALGDFRASTDPDNAPTVLVYGHFDVQPEAPLELWESDPFELTIKDEWAYARGVTDDKGQVFILLKAAQRLVEQNALPVNLRFACDGEEEIGGTTIVDWITIDDDRCRRGDHLRRRHAAGRRAGVRSRDARARRVRREGADGRARSALRHVRRRCAERVHVLMRLFESVLAGPDGRLPEPLRQGIVPPTRRGARGVGDAAAGLGRARRPGCARARRERRGGVLYAHVGRAVRRRQRDLGGKPGLRNTTLSVQASGEFTIRLAPGQDVDTIGAAAEKLVRAAAPEGADVEIEWTGSPPSLFRADSPAIQLGLDAFEKVLGVRPLLVRSGGTLPIMRALADKGIPTILTGFGLPESNVHSPNEKFLVRYFEQGVDTAAELYTALGKLAAD